MKDLEFHAVNSVVFSQTSEVGNQNFICDICQTYRKAQRLLVPVHSSTRSNRCPRCGSLLSTSLLPNTMLFLCILFLKSIHVHTHRARELIWKNYLVNSSNIVLKNWFLQSHKYSLRLVWHVSIRLKSVSWLSGAVKYYTLMPSTLPAPWKIGHFSKRPGSI